MSTLLPHSHITLQEATQLYLQDCKIRNLSKETIRRYRKGLQKFQQQLDSLQKEISEITPSDLTHRIITGMLNEGLSLRSVNCQIAILKELFKFLKTDGWISTNIAAELKAFKLNPSMKHTFTDGHLQCLFAQPDRTTFTGFRNYVMMLVLLETGLRLKELANLRLSDILFQEELLKIQQGKGRKARIVPIQQTCLTHLKRYVQERGVLDHDYVWVNLDNSPFQASGIRVMISRYCQAAQIKGIQCSCHTFRHTFAKHYLLRGGDMFTLKAIMVNTPGQIEPLFR
jgi:integrase/recombinase XerD